MFFKKGTAILCLLLGLSPAAAEEKKPCLIFSGDAGADYAVELAKYNRITFGENAMTLTSSENPDASLAVLYSAYNRFKIGDAEPASAIDELAVDSAAGLSYVKSEQFLVLTSGNDLDEVYSVGVFNLGGALVLRSELRPGDGLSVESLAPGAYVAVAVGHNSTQSIKFVK